MMKTIAILCLLTLLVCEKSSEPKVNDWYEYVPTRERFQVGLVDTGKNLWRTFGWIDKRGKIITSKTLGTDYWSGDSLFKCVYISNIGILKAKIVPLHSFNNDYRLVQ